MFFHLSLSCLFLTWRTSKKETKDIKMSMVRRIPGHWFFHKIWKQDMKTNSFIDNMSFEDKLHVFIFRDKRKSFNLINFRCLLVYFVISVEFSFASRKEIYKIMKNLVSFSLLFHVYYGLIHQMLKVMKSVFSVSCLQININAPKNCLWRLIMAFNSCFQVLID